MKVRDVVMNWNGAVDGATSERRWALAPRRATALVATGAAAAAMMLAGAGEASALTPPVSMKVQQECPAPQPGDAACLSLKQATPKEPTTFRTTAISPNVTPGGYGPSDLRSAYALSATGSASQTVGIVDAQDDPTAESDLAVYRTQYGLPACTTANGCFRKVNQNGASSPLPAADAGWAGEISLDLDMVSAICPNCHILLVEASDASITSLGTSVNTAVSLGAKFVSNSYGGAESSSDPSTTSSYFNHPGVAITASTGDDGYGVSYPASSTAVTAVGGTSLTRSSTSARGWAETAWNGAGSGCSADAARPAFQSGVSSAFCARRAVADVSAVADPNTGVAVYQTYSASGWNIYGGTSVSSPIIASVYALAGNPGASDAPNSYPYSHAANLNDVTAGSNGTCSPAVLCTAAAGWDGPTGLGTPNGIGAFSSTASSTAVSVANPGTKTATLNTAITAFTLSASGGTAPYTWTATGLPAGLTITSAGTISGTPTAAGSFTVTATAKDTKAATGTATFTVTVSSSTGCTAGQKLANPGFESGATGWTASASVIGQNGASEPAHSGTWDAWLDGYGTTHTDTVSQSVSIPAGCTNSTLSFYLHVDTAETTATTQFDKLTVKIGTTVLATYSNLNKAAGYTLRSVPVGSFAGQTATITFTGTEDSSLQTSFVLDDTALNAS